MKTTQKFSRENILVVLALFVALFVVQAHGQISTTKTGTNEYLVSWSAFSGGGATWQGVYISNPNDQPPYEQLAGPSGTWSAGSKTVTITAANPIRQIHWNVDNPNQQGVKATLTYEEATKDCKAKMPAITNTTGYAVHYRLMHSIDGVVATVVVQPGQTTAPAEYDVTCGGSYYIAWQSPDADAAEGNVQDNVWGVLEGSEASPTGWHDEGSPGVPDAPPNDPEAPEPPVPTPTASNGTPLPPAPGAPASPWGGPSEPTADGDRLDKQTYKEGTGKIVSELQKQSAMMKPATPEAAKAAYEEEAEKALETSEVAATEINAALPDSISAGSPPPSSQAGAGDVIYTATVPGVAPAKILGSNTIVFKPGAIAPDWKTWAGLFREVMLFGIGLAFAFYMQRKFELYYLTWWQVTEKTTKPEVFQVTVPKVGWGKQVATALIITGTFVSTIALVITAVNSNLAAVAGSGATVTNAFVGLTGKTNAVFSAIGVIYGFMNAFIPIAAVMQYAAARYTIGWLMAPLWTLAFTVSKYIHL